MDKPIYLIGFMGSGKTTIGQLLGKRIGYKTVDLDHYIIEQTGLEITQIFELGGEAYFREIETKALKELDQIQKGIVCTGGGVVISRENRAFLKNRMCIYLDIGFDTLYERIKGDRKRPLVQKYDDLKRLYETRKVWYEEVATYHLKGDFDTPLNMVEKIIQRIK